MIIELYTFNKVNVFNNVLKSLIIIFYKLCTHIHILMFITGQTVTTIGEEKTYNPRLSKSLDEFIEVMNNLNLAYPKKIG